jgi:hypothetical protein
MKLDPNKTNGSSPPLDDDFTSAVSACVTDVERQADYLAIAKARLQRDVELTPNRHVLAAALEEPLIKEAIHRGVRKACIKKYAAITRHAGGSEYISDFAQATYLSILEEYAEDFSKLAPEERPRFVETIAKHTAWREVYPLKREVPLSEPMSGGQSAGESNGAQVFACDEISLSQKGRHANFVLAHADESELIDRIDRQRAGKPTEEQAETLFERRCRIVGASNADWMLDYENRRYRSARKSAARVRYHRLRKRLGEM